MFSFALAACLAGIAGVLWAMLHNLSPFTGQAIIITLFAVVVLGGLGSITGAFLGGIALGLAEVATAHYFTPQLSLFVAYAVLIAMLLLRPRGLMGASVEAE
jgi:branched-subunit amino acid ABC-type transport system permease component